MTSLEEAAAELVAHPVRPPTEVEALEQGAAQRHRTVRRTRALAIAAVVAVLGLAATAVVAAQDEDGTVEVAGPGTVQAGADGTPHGTLDAPSTWRVTFSDPFLEEPDPAGDAAAVRYDLTSLPAMLETRLSLAGIEGAAARLEPCCDGADPTSLEDLPAKVDVVVEVPGGVDADEVRLLLSSGGLVYAGVLTDDLDNPLACGPEATASYSSIVHVPAAIPELPSPDEPAAPERCIVGHALTTDHPRLLREDGSPWPGAEVPRQGDVHERDGAWSVTLPLAAEAARRLGDQVARCEGPDVFGAGEPVPVEGAPCPSLALDAHLLGQPGDRITASYEWQDGGPASITIGGLTERELVLVKALLGPGGTRLRATAQIEDEATGEPESASGPTSDTEAPTPTDQPTDAPTDAAIPDGHRCDPPPSWSTDLSGEDELIILPGDEIPEGFVMIPDHNRLTDAAGCYVRRDVAYSSTGPLTCQGEDPPAHPAVTLRFAGLRPGDAAGPGSEFTRDPQGLYGDPSLVEGFEAQTDVPADSLDTGLFLHGAAVSIGPVGDDAVYVTADGRTERWPRHLDRPLCD